MQPPSIHQALTTDYCKNPLVLTHCLGQKCNDQTLIGVWNGINGGMRKQILLDRGTSWPVEVPALGLQRICSATQHLTGLRESRHKICWLHCFMFCSFMVPVYIHSKHLRQQPKMTSVYVTEAATAWHLFVSATVWNLLLAQSGAKRIRRRQTAMPCRWVGLWKMCRLKIKKTHLGIVSTIYLWWFGEWCIIVLPTLYNIGKWWWHTPSRAPRFFWDKPKQTKHTAVK